MNSSRTAPDQLHGLARVAAACFDHRRRVLSIWAMTLVAVIAVSQIVGGHLSNSFSQSDSPSGRAQTFLAKSFPAQAGDAAQIVIQTTTPIASASNARRIDQLVTAVSPLPHVSGVTSPLGPTADHQVSASHRIAYARIQFDEQSDMLPAAAINRVIATAQRFAAPASGSSWAAIRSPACPAPRRGPVKGSGSWRPSSSCCSRSDR